MSDGDSVDWQGLNRANWDDRVPVHVASEFYDLDGFRAGFSSGFQAGAGSLRPFEATEAGDVAGRRLVHLQCHLGLDTLSWAGRGALVTGLDFSAPATAAARSLAASVGVDATFVTADVYDAVAALGGQRFDVAYASIGSLVWLPDIPRWAAVVAALLEPGGFLYLVDGHPVANILDDARGATVTRDYFSDQPEVEDFAYTYTDGPALAHTRSVQFQHTLGEIVTAAAGAGLRLDFLHEHDADAFQRYEALERHGTEYRYPAGQPRAPQMYSLRATRPP